MDLEVFPCTSSGVNLFLVHNRLLVKLSDRETLRFLRCVIFDAHTDPSSPEGIPITDGDFVQLVSEEHHRIQCVWSQMLHFRHSWYTSATGKCCLAQDGLTS
eukprot:1669011-Amphidinium_carterae.1